MTHLLQFLILKIKLKEMKKTSDDEIEGSTVYFHQLKIMLPLEMIWEPKEDITTYELAMCTPYLFRYNIMSYEVDSTLPHFRHFKIIDHNI